MPAEPTRGPLLEAAGRGGGDAGPGRAVDVLDGRAVQKGASSARPAIRISGAWIAGVAVALLLGRELVAFLRHDAPPVATPVATPVVPAPAPRAVNERPLTHEPVKIEPPPAPSLPEPAPQTPPEPEPVVVEEPEGDAVLDVPSDPLSALAARSSTHSALAQLLRDYAALFTSEALTDPGPMFETFQDRQRREEELIARARNMGPVAVGALRDLLLGVDQRQHRIFLAKALAGLEGPDAQAAVRQILAEVQDVAVQTTLVRFLPETPEAAATVGESIAQEEDPNLRCMLLRELHRRLPASAAGEDVFRRLARDDPDPNVRAEAVMILGRRGDSRDQALMEQIIASEANLQIRQRAIVAYAETGRDSSLAYLESLVHDANTVVAIRASAVLAIGSVGGAAAIQALETIAQSDPSQEIRSRAERLAQSLRQRAEKGEGALVETSGPARRLDPPAPLEKR